MILHSPRDGSKCQSLYLVCLREEFLESQFTLSVYLPMFCYIYDNVSRHVSWNPRLSSTNVFRWTLIFDLFVKTDSELYLWKRIQKTIGLFFSFLGPSSSLTKSNLYPSTSLHTDTSTNVYPRPSVPTLPSLLTLFFPPVERTDVG